MPGGNAKRASVTGPADPTPPDLGPVMRISAGRNIGRCALAPLSRGGSGDEGREHLRGHGEVNMLFSQRPLRPAILRSAAVDTLSILPLPCLKPSADFLSTATNLS